MTNTETYKRLSRPAAAGCIPTNRKRESQGILKTFPMGDSRHPRFFSQLGWYVCSSNFSFWKILTLLTSVLPSPANVKGNRRAKPHPGVAIQWSFHRVITQQALLPHSLRTCWESPDLPWERGMDHVCKIGSPHEETKMNTKQTNGRTVQSIVPESCFFFFFWYMDVLLLTNRTELRSWEFY